MTPTLDTMRDVYVRRMDIEGLDLNDTAARFVVRLWDGMDGAWVDVTGEVGGEAALATWWTQTSGGTTKIAYEEIDYVRIFPAGTRMTWDGSEGREMFR